MNVAADSGNTPLHAAVNRGDVAAVRDLLDSPGIHVDAVNNDCGDVTPLLLAAMHGLHAAMITRCQYSNMTANGCIAVAAEIDPSYSPGGAIVHCHDGGRNRVLVWGTLSLPHLAAKRIFVQFTAQVLQIC